MACFQTRKDFDMSNRLPLGMAEATRLTQAGDLMGATALIQRLLQGGDVPEPAHTSSGSPTIIDVEPIVLDDTDTQPTARLSATAAQPASEFTGKFHPKPTAGLAETLRDLAAKHMPAGLDIDGLSGGFGGLNGIPRPVSEPLPEGATFETATFTNPAGTRDYKLYVPASRTGQPMPLIVMLHGCTQSPDDFAAGTCMNALAEEHGCLVAYPAQPSSANANKCWNWFNANDQGRDRGEPSLIAGITRQIMKDHPVDPSRVYVAGLSAGGAAAAIMGAAFPEVFPPGGGPPGLPGGAPRHLSPAFVAMSQGATGSGLSTRVIPTIVFHGDKDFTVHASNGDAVVAQSKATGTGLRPAIQRGRAPGGHAYSRTVHTNPSGKALCEQWTIHGAGHAWAGGSSSGSYTDPRGPNASREMVRFFFEHRNAVTLTV